MTLLQLVQEFCRRTGLATPNAVVSHADKGILQLWGLLNELPEDLTTRKAFQQNTREATFTSTAAEDQGAIATLAPSGFQGIIRETVFDRTDQRPLCGGLSPVEWQVNKATQSTSPFYEYRVRNGRLLFSPALPASHSIAFEYVSSYFIQDESSVAKEYWSADTDTFLLPDMIALAWLRWKWKSEKGLEYAEDFRKYELIVAAYLLRNDSPQAADLSGQRKSMQPGVLVPEGSWSIV
jgi:hypothetical protein